MKGAVSFRGMVKNKKSIGTQIIAWERLTLGGGREMGQREWVKNANFRSDVLFKKGTN